MKLIKVKHCSTELVAKMITWCGNSFNEGGTNKDWLYEHDTDTFVFWDESFYAMFLMRWLGQRE